MRSALPKDQKAAADQHPTKAAKALALEKGEPPSAGCGGSTPLCAFLVLGVDHLSVRFFPLPDGTPVCFVQNQSAAPDKIWFVAASATLNGLRSREILNMTLAPIQSS